MIAWVFVVPVMLAVLLLVLDRLEAVIVAPIHRAEQVMHLLESGTSHIEVERRVAVLLAPVLAYSPFQERSLAGPRASR